MTASNTFKIGAVVAVYLSTVVATMVVSGHHVLPLFEGVGPPPAYQWVTPPPAFASANVKPRSASFDFDLTGPAGPAAANSPDGQFAVNLPPAPFAPHGPDSKVHATITPLDPATLGPLPAQLVPDGNAYRIDFRYQPSATAITTLAHPGNVIMTAPYQAQSLLYSPDGRSWTALVPQHLADPTMIGATFTAAGDYLVGTTASATKSVQPAGSRGAGTGLIATAVLVAALILGLIALTAARRRQRR